MMTGIVELDLHGLTPGEAQKKIDRALEAADRSVYTLRLIHGYHGGTSLRAMIREEYSWCRHSKVLRIRSGDNPGITELVLREL